MSELKALYIWTLTILLILAGCLGTGAIIDSEGQSTDDSNNSDDSSSSDNTDDSSSSDHIDDSNSSSNTNNTDDSNSSDSTDDSSSSDHTDDSGSSNHVDDSSSSDTGNNQNNITNYQEQFGVYAIGGSIENAEGDASYYEVATINTMVHPNFNNFSWNMVLVSIHELHVGASHDSYRSMKFSTVCDNGNLFFNTTVDRFPAEEQYLNYLPGAAFDCTHTVFINAETQQGSTEIYWSLVYSVDNEPFGF